ncbi:MAG: glycoside hydrolase family 9 protein [Ruminococcus sp.]|nr:glycoside hydrolase family 9 protein [Ruminococcus sp.]
MNINKIKAGIIGGAMTVATVLGPFSAAVPSITADAAGGGDDYARLLQYSLYFYDANMCGDKVDERGGMSWRSDCHTQDAVLGGFHDAGDHVKFGLPGGYAASVLGWSYYEFKDAYTGTGLDSHLKTLTDHFCEFFRASTTLSGDSVSSFVYQVGDGDADHGYWGPPEKQDASSRKIFSTTNSASDIAAEYAAALAANYVNFGNADDLKYAKALFNFSTKNNSFAAEGTSGFYYDAQWASYKDDQAWAAAWLYLATKDNTYKSFLDGVMSSEFQWGIYNCMGWNNAEMGAACLQAEIEGDWSKVTDCIGRKGGGSNSYFFDQKWGSARYNCSAQMAALVASKHNAGNYYDWAKGQMDYILGNKGVGGASAVCFVTGFADNSAKNAHHRAASGYQSAQEMSGQTGYSSNGHVLIGALVGGPTSENGEYNDSIQDYTANEVALDYNAGLVGAAAGLYSKYKTGKVVDSSTIPGVKGGTVIVDPTQPAVTTAKSDDPIVTTQAPVTTKAPDGTGQRVEAAIGTDGGYPSFDPKGADYAEVVLSGLPSNQSGFNGGLGYTGASGWTTDRFEFSSDGSGKATVKLDLADAKNANSAQIQIWWPQEGTKVDSVTLIYNSAVTPTTPVVTTAAPVVTTAAPKPTSIPDVTVNFGDANCNGEVNLSDAVAILQYVALPAKYPLTAQGLLNADVVDNGTSGVNGTDGLAIQMVDAKLISTSEFPITNSRLQELAK